MENIIETGGPNSPSLNKGKEAFLKAKTILLKNGYEEIIIDDFYSVLDVIFTKIEFSTYSVSDLFLPYL